MSDETNAVLDVDDSTIEELVGQIHDFEQTLSSDERESFNAEALRNLSPFSEEELQQFLEERSGISPEEEPQGSLMAAAATVAIHC